MNITARITTSQDGPGSRRTVDILIEPASFGLHDRRPPHRIILDTDGPLCDVKGFLFDTVTTLVNDELGHAPKRYNAIGLAVAADCPVPSASYRDASR